MTPLADGTRVGSWGAGPHGDDQEQARRFLDEQFQVKGRK
jgi:hypothetical protein